LISVIIPVYRDAEALARTLRTFDASGVEVVVVAPPDDADALRPLRAAHPSILWIHALRGRARQMNAGAAVARGRWLLFLHADTQLTLNWRQAVEAADRHPDVSAGCFRFALDSTALAARVIELGVRIRVRAFALPYGDQGLFVRRAAFEAINGFADIPIMEDVDLVRRLRSYGRLFRSPLPAVTSARRWERDGWVGRTLRHLGLILLYFCGVSPERLVRLDRARHL
jgi:rSAM/selenodomain-associated transferase 2